MYVCMHVCMHAAMHVCMYVWMYTLLCLLSNCRCNPSCCQSETCRTPKDYCGTRLVWLGVSVVLRIRLMLPVGSVCGQATNPETPSSWGLNSLKSLSKLVRIGTVAVWSSTPALHRKRPTVVCTSWCPEMFPNCKKNISNPSTTNVFQSLVAFISFITSSVGNE